MEIINLVKVSVTAFCLCSLAACDSDKNDEPVTPVAGTEFNGTWRSACSASELDNTTNLFETTQLSIIGTRATSVIASFTDSGCQNTVLTDLDESTDITINYTISRPEETTATGLGTATNVDLTATSITIGGVPLAAGDQLLLGIENQRFDLFLTVNNRLYLGDTSGDNDGTSDETRPDSLNQSGPLTRRFI